MAGITVPIIKKDAMLETITIGKIAFMLGEKIDKIKNTKIELIKPNRYHMLFLKFQMISLMF